MGNEMKVENRIAIFNGKEIRKTILNGEWWFVINDVVAVLTDSRDVRQYIKRLRARDNELNEAFKGGVHFVPPLGIEFDTEGGVQLLQCWNTKGIFRLIQSIPSPKAEPFKRWLAKVGYERIQEIENPEIASKRMREIYQSKGYSDEWIEKRMRGIAVRDELTGEWDKRGVKEEREFSILTAETSKATFGMTPSEYKEFKNLENENLRDHMTDLELIFTMLGEASTTKIARVKDAKGFEENKVAAKKGGEVAGSARKDLEKKIGESIVSDDNYLQEPEKVKRLKGRK